MQKRFWPLLALWLSFASGWAWADGPAPALSPTSPSASESSNPSEQPPAQTPLPLEESFKELRDLLDNWATDSDAVSSQLDALLPTVRALESSLTASRRLADSLALSAQEERERAETEARRAVWWRRAAAFLAAVAVGEGIYIYAKCR